MQKKTGRRARFHVGHLIGLVVVVGLVGAIVYGWKHLKATTPEAPYTAGPVHWHAAFEVELCGKKQDFSSYGATQHAGSALLHTHGDGVIHIEGRVLKPEDIALGNFFDNIKVPFDRDRIMDKKNSDECAPGKPGVVKMLVNGEPNQEFRNYIPKPTENGSDQRISIVFE